MAAAAAALTSSVPSSQISPAVEFLPKRTAKTLSGAPPGLLSSFVGDKGRLCASGGVSIKYRAPNGCLPLGASSQRDGFPQVGDGVNPLFRKSFHVSSGRETSSAERTAVATSDYAVAEEERRTVTENGNGFPAPGRSAIFGYSGGDEDEDEFDDEEGEVLRVDNESTDDEDELAIANLGLPQDIVDSLAKRGIFQLFPIQRAVLDPAMEGKDLIGRAKTGTGKTLAFGIPIINRIVRENQENRTARRSGRAPRALVLAPTRELAKQVEREFMESAPSLSTICVYGGVSITGQQRQLQKGVDIAVGTPGRIIDLIDRGSLKLHEVQFLVLDEADQMLAVGFEEDVEKILEGLPSERQSMLFSATMPAWVKNLSRKYLKKPLTIDLVGESDEKLAEGIKLFCVNCVASAKRSILNDLITVYAKGGKTIVFTQTKRDADDVSLSMSRLVGCEALHGDITQAQREKTLNAFREGKFSVLVATDVAARGLDIPNVDLVVHFEIPNDPETFVHRSGRTGRAGKAGTAILLFTSQQTRTMKQIERDVGCKFDRIVPPSVDEVLSASSDQATEVIRRVHPQLIDVFMPTAEKLLAESGPGALAAAIAHLSGFSQPPASRSLITFEEGLTTLRLIRTNKAKGGRLVSARAVMGTLADIYPAAADQVGKIKIIDDRNIEGAVFDLPEDVAKELLTKPRDAGDLIDVPKSLPRIEEDDSGRRSDMYGRSFGRGGGGGGFRGGDRDDRRSSSSRFGGGRDFGDRGGRDFGDRGGRFSDSGDRGGRSDFGERRFEDRSRSSSRFESSDDDYSSPRRGGGRGGAFSGTCYVCNQPGHRASDCPKGRR
ncbi:ATP-dependent RNA helicase DDX21 [Marchantia polymorpha subsp. ruderalis]|nr:hypothetical protein MARPO_0039s0077 [Marchantia polymorpha]BBN05938.1 hypothetical protein Mp_3g17170 [Marchantia polymorpha subsp. ruderalis]|eukprot:PTQ40586.1 hypothetical protein MARPO_0039s0077 [Marchantia polymorpha]